MGQLYLLDLADECRRALAEAARVHPELAGIPVHEVNLWEFEARSSGGFDAGAPSHTMFHHTASGVSWDYLTPMRRDGQLVPRDVQYMLEDAGARPLANLFVRREPTVEVWVMAGGATNTNGSGDCWWPGGCPPDDMNRWAIGIECGNSGVGEPWGRLPLVVSALAVRFSDPAGYAIPLERARAHWEYTTNSAGPFPPGTPLPGSRKIDGAGPHGASPYARQNPTDGSGRFDMDRWRADTAALAAAINQPAPEPEPEPAPEEPEEDLSEMLFLIEPTYPGVDPYVDPVVVQYASGHCYRATNAHTAYAAANGIPTEQLDSKEQYDDLLATHGISRAG